MSWYSGELCSYRVVLFWGLAEFALCLPRRACGKDLGLCWAPWAAGAGPQSSGGQGPSPEQPEGASASPQDHHEAPAVQTSSASSLLGISSQPLFVCAFGSATTRKWEYLAYTRCAPRGMSAVFHLLLGTAKARDGGERWMGIICCEANHSRHREPSGAGALQHLCSFCILATMEPPGRARRSCCSCVLE